MADYIETLWAQFVIESEEHLELIEPLLVEAEFNEPSRENVDQLFRSFHSIKGLSKAMDLLGMETVAHRAEDILGLVRDGVISIDAKLADALLASIDALKQHLRFAEIERKDQVPDESLISRLETVFNTITGVVLTEETVTDVINDQITDIESVGSVIHNDPDMVIFFAELLESNVPSLACLLVAQLDVQDIETKEALSELETLIHAATTMELPPLANAFSLVVKFLDDTNLSTKERRESLIESLMGVVELIRIIELDIKKECGTRSLVIELRACAAQMIERLFQELSEKLQEISVNSTSQTLGGTPEVVALAIETAEKSAILNNYLHVLDGSDTSKRLLLTVSEVCNHINQGQAVPATDLIKLLLNAVSVAETEYRIVTGDEKTGGNPVDWNDLHQKIWDAINQQNNFADNEKVHSFKELAQKITINPIFEDCMSMDNILLLQEAIEDGQRVYEAMVNLEESEAFTIKFLQWVEDGVVLVTNSTVFVEDKPWSDCLLLTGKSDSELRESAKNLDPNRSFLKLESCELIGTKDSAEESTFTNAPIKEQSMLRVSGAALDRFMNQIGEMVSIRGMLNHAVHCDGAKISLAELKQLGNGLKIPDFDNDRYLNQLDVLEQQLARFEQVDEKLHTVLSQLQDSALALRVVPMETVFKRFPRSVRDLSQSQGKQVKLEMTGQDVRIDKAMVDVLSDPLMHMIRNSVDHGIELPEDRVSAGKKARATVVLEARQQGNTVKVTVTDDGRGINVVAVKAKALANGLVSEEKLEGMSEDDIMQFIFAPGFSTAEKVTETSGRGVGMDVVRTNVMKLGGAVTVSSEKGKGSCFTLKLPLSAAIQDTVLVKASGQLMAIPERYVTEIIEVKREDVQPVKGCQAIVLRDCFLPIYRLGPLLGYRSAKDC
ncbi:MAG: Hpt domain-containing protein, partial [Flavobacteriales bacterium]|nr:Hpt domain-containing protein [Flavobacteriales bacterium]